MESPPVDERATAPPEPGSESELCECERPVPVERAERRGAARTYCARCGHPVPIRLGR